MTTQIKYNKRSEVKFNTVQEFLSENRVAIIRAIRVEFRFVNYDLKTVMVDYMNFLISEKTEFVTNIIRKKILATVITRTVEAYNREINPTFSENTGAKEDFKEELKRDAFASKSI